GTGFGGGLPVTAVCDRYGDTYSVSMRLWGGEVTTGPGGQVRYQVEDRTAVEAGVCSCTNGTVDGWSDDCRRDECPYRAEFVGEENIKAWNPISAPEIAVKRYVPSEGFQPLYPVYCGDPWDPCDADRVSARENQLVFGRKMPFTRDPARNAHRFTWAWPEARQFPMMTALPLPYGSPGRTTRIRASWPNFGESYLPPFYDTQVTYSRAVPVGASSGNCLGEIYLGPAFIVDRIPGQVDLLPDDRSRTARLPGGWLLGETLAEGRPLLYRLAPGTLHVEAVQELGLPSGVDLLSAPVSSHVGLLPAGLLGAEGKAMTLALALYAPGEPAPPQPPDPPTHEEPPSPASPARLLLGSLESGLVVALTDVAERTGAPTPWLDEAQVVLLPGRGQVLLVGRDPSGASAPVAYRLRLEEGAWSGPHALAGLGNRQGFSIVRDAFGDRLLVFGGRLLGGPVTGGPGTGDPDTGGPSTSVADSADLFALDPDTLIARRLPFDALEGAARSRAGLFLHGEGRQLFVVGGERSGSPLATGFVIDLLRGSAAALDLAAGPGALADPFVYFDDREGRLWVADLVGASISNGLTLWALGEDGLWQAARTSVGVEASSFPAQGSYLAGRASVYFVEAAASADWPGQVFVASLVSSGAQLRLSAQSATADLLCESTGQDTDLEQAAFACLPGSSCRLALSLGTTDEWTGAAVPFTLDVRKAALGPAESRLLPVPATDLVLHRGSLVVTSPLGLGLMDAATLDWTGLATGPGMVAAQAVTTCGSYHCVARLGSEGLKVLDLSDPASPEVKGGALTPGLGWDVAASGARVFVAHGVLGVGIYELGPGGQVFWQQTLFGG
ncbi:MAG: hypothetical protein RBU30_27910, partial [Polyangia bacterium]|nr:hypothetical protein [Polyangia bacterium]